MFCVNCGKEAENGAKFCGFCGKPQTAAAPPQHAPPPAAAVPAPAYARGKEPPGLQPFVPPPLTKEPVRGAGYAGLLGFLAWVAALAGPVLSMTWGAMGFAAMIRGVIYGTVVDIPQIIRDFELTADTLWSIEGVWLFLAAIPGALAKMISGGVLLLLALVPLFIMCVTLRTAARIARASLFAGFALCMAGDWLCLSVLARLENAGIFLTPYDTPARIALIAMAAAAALWLAAVWCSFSRQSGEPPPDCLENS